MSQLKLYSGVDIPFPEARLSVHQPTIREISWIGEKRFFRGCEFLYFSKEKFLNDKGGKDLETQTNFDIFMAIVCDKSSSAFRQVQSCASAVLMLLFPSYKISFTKQGIRLLKDEEEHYIDNSNFEKFKFILSKIFCLSGGTHSASDYNPDGDRAARIAAQLKKGRARAAAAKGEQTTQCVFARYISILSIGQNIPVQELLNYTVFQLYEEFTRYNSKQAFDSYVQQCLAGAKNPKKPEEHWMEDINLEK